MVRAAQRRDTTALVHLWWQMMHAHQKYDPRFTFHPEASRDVERRLLDAMRHRDCLVLVAEVGSCVVGYIEAELHERRPVYPTGTYGFIAEISVEPAQQRLGIGTCLVQLAMEWFQSRGVSSVELFAAEANPNSQAFWAALGFGSYLRLLRKELKPMPS